MVKISTDSTLIERFLTRGVEKIFPTTEALREKLMSGQKLRVYQGFDPSGPHLHVGHAMGIRALRILQELGHEVIFLVGDFTAKVGDPDKTTARKLLTDDEIEANMKGWKDQASQLIDFEGENAVQFKHNHEWLSKLKLEDLIKLMSKATVQQMIERELFDKRMKRNDPIGLHELIYPLMQGYDGVAMDVDMEMGGTDQTFNMLMGRQLIKTYLNKEKFVRTNKMMEAPDGLTMSKTRGNGINLADTPENMYGKAMSYPDRTITMGLELLTDIPMEKVAEVEKEMKAGVNPMIFKKLMAYEIVKTLKGEASAKKAQEHFEKTVQNKTVEDTDTVEVKLGKGAEKMTILDFLKKENVMGDKTSAGEIKRIIQQGGVSVGEIQVKDINQEIDPKPGTIIKYGKRNYFKIV